jgi:hypothetical protein
VSSDWISEFISPEDRGEIESTAEAIVRDDGMWLEVSLMTPAEGARDFLDTYDRAQEGDIMAMFSLLTFLGTIADTLQHGLDMEPDD